MPPEGDEVKSLDGEDTAIDMGPAKDEEGGQKVVEPVQKVVMVGRCGGESVGIVLKKFYTLCSYAVLILLEVS